ncbi:MAG TPA: hypothetical protein VIV06_07630, partial [Candidatus Limnocylindrales bacterium]
MTERTALQYVDGREVGGTERALLNLAAGLLAEPGWRPIIAHHDRPELRAVVAEAEAAGIE